MKNLIFILISFLTLNSVYSQKNYDTNSLISGIDILKLGVSEMMLLKDEYKSNGVDELYSLKYKKQKNHYFYFYVNLTDKVIKLRKRELYTETGFINNITSTKNSLSFEFTKIHPKNINKYKFYDVKIIVNSNNNVELLIVEKNIKGKTKVFFTKELKLEKITS
jgi:hypothetical protein